MHTAKREPWAPCPVSLDERRAIRALATGTASDRQQKLALDWMIYTASGTYGLSARSADSHATYFAEGRRYVGATIVGILNSSEKPAATEGEVKDG